MTLINVLLREYDYVIRIMQFIYKTCILHSIKILWCFFLSTWNKLNNKKEIYFSQSYLYKYKYILIFWIYIQAERSNLTNGWHYKGAATTISWMQKIPFCEMVPYHKQCWRRKTFTYKNYFNHNNLKQGASISEFKSDTHRKSW